MKHIRDNYLHSRATVLCIFLSYQFDTNWELTWKNHISKHHKFCSVTDVKLRHNISFSLESGDSHIEDEILEDIWRFEENDDFFDTTISNDDTYLSEESFC